MRKTTNTLNTTILGKNTKDTLAGNDYARHYGENKNLYLNFLIRSYYLLR
jgi:hypothetical protein